MIAYKYPDVPHARRHGPFGYDNYTSYKQWLRDDFVFRCAYCLHRERWSQNTSDAFGVDHFEPQIHSPDLVVDYDNLVYACARCNSNKRDQHLLNPCEDAMSEHIQASKDGDIEAFTSEGLDFVQILDLNDPSVVEFRHRLIKTLEILVAADALNAREQVKLWLGFPVDLPDLARLRPKGNSRPDGIAKSFHFLRAKGMLPETY
jgi:hypothetical protein